MSELRHRVREARKKVGMTQEGFAAHLGVSRSAVANWETGVGIPDMPNLLKIAETTGMGFEYLATGRGREDYGDPKINEDAPPSYATRSEAGRAQSPAELSLLIAFRGLSEARRKALLALIKSD